MAAWDLSTTKWKYKQRPTTVYRTNNHQRRSFPGLLRSPAPPRPRPSERQESGCVAGPPPPDPPAVVSLSRATLRSATSQACWSFAGVGWFLLLLVRRPTPS